MVNVAPQLQFGKDMQGTDKVPNVDGHRPGRFNAVKHVARYVGRMFAAYLLFAAAGVLGMFVGFAFLDERIAFIVPIVAIYLMIFVVVVRTRHASRLFSPNPRQIKVDMFDV